MMMTRMMKRRGKSGVGQLDENEEIRNNLQKEKKQSNTVIYLTENYDFNLYCALHMPKFATLYNCNNHKLNDELASKYEFVFSDF